MGRYRSLDGLRGVAAVIVVFYHLTLVVPAVSSVVVDGRDPGTGSGQWWLTRTPLAVLFAGHEAVLVFFMLSGIVLTLPLQKAFTWLSYYPRRLCRLYLPVWGALALAYVLATRVHRIPGFGSSWLQSHHAPTGHAVAKDAALLFGTSNLDSPLWSLRWEMWFSLLLPVMWLLLRLLRGGRYGLPLVVVLAGVSVVARFPAVTTHLPSRYGMAAGLLQYLPVFGIGMVIAVNLERLSQLAQRVTRGQWPWLIVAALLLMAGPHLAGGRDYGPKMALAYAGSLAGVVIILFAALESAPVKAFLERPAMQWAGSRSFSLYLVHEPIIVAMALMTHSHSGLHWLLPAAGAATIALIAAELFYRAVERPTLRLSRLAGRVATPRRPLAAGAHRLG